ncbi:BURP domain-containing protein 3-like [Impatiens glandulifera]|uniref:BURP domain-containing protein 3-like n=1 Tax=Impatiens glandulifera TaxID=253017 RepID=UPI001FB0971E|nr:BURP domain-containing protein 3-like [Impatiens glandulifera]
MEFHHLFHVFFTFLFVILVGISQAEISSSPQGYWNSVLPNTPIPKSIKDLLYPEWADEKSTSVQVGKGGVNVQTGKGGGTNVNVGHGGVGVQTGQPGKGTNVNVGHGGVGVQTGQPGKGTNVNVGKGGVGVQTGQPGKGTNVNVGKGGVGVQTGHPGKGTNVNVGHGGVGVQTGKPGKGTNVGVGKGGVTVSTGHKGKPVYVNVKPGYNPFNYRYAATDDQIHDNPDVALFFLEKDIRTGKKMNLQFTKTTNDATFLPRQVADTTPFSSNKLPEILNQFSVKPESNEAKIIKKTIEECEEPGIKGEEKYCATSLESMIDFTTSKLGTTRLNAVSTEADKGSEWKDEYAITQVQQVANKVAVVCHKQNYGYAVFYCHKTDTARAYTVALRSVKSGAIVKAVAVCHKDTSGWNPKHLAFQVLKVKPGTVPICHFLPEDHIVWVPY